MTVHSKTTYNVPAWLALGIALLGPGLTVIADRIAVASQTSIQEERIVNLEQEHAKMFEEMKEIKKGIDANAIRLQQIQDRQEEVRRTLKLR